MTPKPAQLDFENEVNYLYRCFDADGVLLYVGVAKNVANRLDNHRHASHRLIWPSKVARNTVEAYANRRAALAAEAQAILTEKPLHNKARKQTPLGLGSAKRQREFRTRMQERGLVSVTGFVPAHLADDIRATMRRLCEEAA